LFSLNWRRLYGRIFKDAFRRAPKAGRFQVAPASAAAAISPYRQYLPAKTLSFLGVGQNVFTPVEKIKRAGFLRLDREAIVLKLCALSFATAA
jgi:hypothetical protein